MVTVARSVIYLQKELRTSGRAYWKVWGSHARHLVDAFGDREVSDLTYFDLEDYKASRAEEGARPATINRELACVSRIVGWLKAIGELSGSHNLQISRLSERDNVRRGFLTPDQWKRLDEALRERDEDVADLVLYLYFTGRRSGESKLLEWSMVELSAEYGWVLVPASIIKTRRDQRVPLVGPVLRMMRRRLEARACEWVFSRGDRQLRDFRGTWKVVVHELGMPDCRPHDLRRSAVRNFMRAEVPGGQATAMSLSGHATADVFQRYNITASDDLVDGAELVSKYVEGFSS